MCITGSDREWPVYAVSTIFHVVSRFAGNKERTKTFYDRAVQTATAVKQSAALQLQTQRNRCHSKATDTTIVARSDRIDASRRAESRLQPKV